MAVYVDDLNIRADVPDGGRVVRGRWSHLFADTETELRAFATRIGQEGDYRFLHKTEDGGYVYEYDRPTAPHDQVKAAAAALGWPRTAADLRSGNFAAVFTERHDLPAAWAEITGKTQNAESRLFTIYLGADGRITAIK